MSSNELNDIMENCLGNFICDPDLKEFEEKYCKKFNIFSCLGLSRLEIRHSYFLKWLLDPYETHGFDDSFLKIFLKNVLINEKNSVSSFVKNGKVEMLEVTEDEQGKQCEYHFPNIFDIHCWDMSSAQVDREVNNIDIQIVDNTNNFVCIIENKIDICQHDNQLTKYRKDIDSRYPDNKNGKKLFIYLKPECNEELEKPYIHVGYDIVLDSINELLNNKINVSSHDIIQIIKDYKAIIESEIMNKNDDLKNMCAKLYRKHFKAINTISKFGDPQCALCDIIEKILKDNGKIKNVNRIKNHTILCLPSDIDDEKIKKLQIADWKENQNLFFAIRFDVLKNKNNLVYSEILFKNSDDKKANDIIEKIKISKKIEVKDGDIGEKYTPYTEDSIIIKKSEYLDNNKAQEELIKVIEGRIDKIVEFYKKVLMDAINEII